MIERIEIIRNVSNLESSCYMELSLGKFQGKYWQDSSIFISDEVFVYIENIFRKNVPDYDHYEINDADTAAWIMIIYELKALSTALRSATKFEDIADNNSFICVDKQFKTKFSFCKTQLYTMIDELLEWAEKNIVIYGHIAILGM